MTVPPPDEPPQQRRVVAYRRANQGAAHYRPLRRGRPTSEPTPTPGPTSRMAKVANRRRFVLFIVAVLVAVAFGTAIFGVVLANPAPMARGPASPTQQSPEPSIQPLPPAGRGAPVELRPSSDSDSQAGTTAPRRAPTTTPAAGAGGDADSTVTYQNCNKAERAGALPLRSGEPGYSAKLDKDGNGIACDEKKQDKG